MGTKEPAPVTGPNIEMTGPPLGDGKGSPLEWPDARIDRRTVEHLTLASYAIHSTDSRGRRHAEAQHPYRGPFTRDRDRILHSSAFRRLSGKMQVFTGEMGIYHRTRLTHTLEVASIARTIARVLRLNEDLVEAMALMHDLGHPPFGHCGEDLLDERMTSVGGFSHNRFALTIVTQLETRYADFAGLNLSVETLAGQDDRTHKDDPDRRPLPSLEAQVVDLADSIAYDAHDVDDAIQMGLLSVDELAELSIIRESLSRLRQRHGVVPTRGLRQLLVHELVDLQVGDLVHQSLDRLRPYDGYSAEQMAISGPRLGHGRPVAEWRIELERFLFDTVYRHPELIVVRQRATERLARLFDALTADPDRLPLRFRRRRENYPVRRVVGEYLAGMTDQFCNRQFESFRDGGAGPLADW